MRNCVFYDNYAEEGGAVFTYHGGNPLFENCDFIENQAKYGAATLDRGGVNSKYENCEFVDNRADYKGGAVFVDYGSMATFDDSRFENNAAGTSGGALYVIDRASQAIPNETDIALLDPDWSNPTDIFSSVLIRNSLFTRNSAGVDGGALYIYESSQAKVTGSTFTANSAARNGAIISLNDSTLYFDADNSIQATDKGIYLDSRSSIVE